MVKSEFYKSFIYWICQVLFLCDYFHTVALLLLKKDNSFLYHEGFNTVETHSGVGDPIFRILQPPSKKIFSDNHGQNILEQTQ